jgi:PAS domain-containing protein
VPISCDEGERALLVALSPRPGELGEMKRDFAQSLANALASALARARSEEKLRKSEEEARLVVEGAREYAIFLLSPDGKIMSWNLGAQRLKGYTAAEVLGRSMDILYTPRTARAACPPKS